MRHKFPPRDDVSIHQIEVDSAGGLSACAEPSLEQL
jgi:hypothetical protein